MKQPLFAGPLLAAGVLLGASLAGAEDEAEAEEAAEAPLETLALTDTAFTQEAWELQITLSPAVRRWTSPDVTFATGGLELELGLTDRLQIAVEGALAHSRAGESSATGLAPTELGVSYNVLASRGVVFTPGLELALPASSDEVGEDGFSAAPFVLGDIAIGKLHVSAFGELEIDAEGELATGLGGALYLDFETVVPSFEVAAELEQGDALVELAPGVFIHPAAGWELGAAAIIGVSDAAPDYGARLLFTRELSLGSEGTDP